MSLGFAIELPPIFLCTSQKEFDAVSKKFKLHPTGWLDKGNACTHTADSENGDLMFVVCISLEKPTEVDYIQVAVLLVHEACHVWQQLCEEYGEDNPGDETEAYTIQCISDSLLRQYHERLFKPTKETK